MWKNVKFLRLWLRWQNPHETPGMCMWLSEVKQWLGGLRHCGVGKRRLLVRILRGHPWKAMRWICQKATVPAKDIFFWDNKIKKLFLDKDGASMFQNRSNIVFGRINTCTLPNRTNESSNWNNGKRLEVFESRTFPSKWYLLQGCATGSLRRRLSPSRYGSRTNTMPTSGRRANHRVFKTGEMPVRVGEPQSSR